MNNIIDCIFEQFRKNGKKIITNFGKRQLKFLRSIMRKQGSENLKLTEIPDR